jgi:DNA polymerase I-like protein with 3'-5' exonuclease and polymerase domains
LKVGHNISYDYKVLKVTNDIVLDKVHDTMVSEYVLNTGRTTAKGFYSLEKTHIRYFNTNPYGDQLSFFDPYIPKSTRSKFGDEPFSDAEIFYGATDIITTDKVYGAQLTSLIDNDLLRVAKLENKFVLCLGDMELEGMPIDVDRWLELDEWSKDKKDEALTKLSSEFPEVKN